MLKAAYCRYTLQFRQPAITSREVMLEKPTYFIKVWDETNPDRFGIGECGLFPGLSCDDRPDYEERLADVCSSINEFQTSGFETLADYPSVIFGLETALCDLHNGGCRVIFPGEFVEGRRVITINGLVWMGTIDEMLTRLAEKLESGFRCVKFKVGGLDFEQELRMLRAARNAFSADELEIRLDANGGFTSENAMQRLDTLSQFEIHSIEQPIRAGQWQTMARLCETSPIPIALDEELIGINRKSQMEDLIFTIRPAYIILKPSLCGGFSGCRNWIDSADEYGVGWWATSALESNIGLNAIAQWVSNQPTSMPQGLGTGRLYLNNIPSPISQVGESLFYSPERQWLIPELQWK